MSECTTILSRIKRAKQIVELSSQGLWMGIGRSTTAWVDDLNPPTPDPLLTVIPELVGAFYISTCSLVTEDALGSINTNYGKYEAYDINTPLETLLDNLVFKVYMTFFIDAKFAPLNTTYRLFGLMTNVEFFYPVSFGQGVFVPAVNINKYDLEWINTFPSQTIISNQMKLMQFIMEF